MTTTILRLCLCVAFAVAFCARSHSQNIVPNLADGTFGASADANGGNGAVLQTAYTGLPIGNIPPPPLPNGPPPVVAGPMYVAPANSAPQQVIPAPGEVIYSPTYAPSANWNCPSLSTCRTSSWTAGIEFLPMDSHITEFEFGPLEEDDAGAGLRGILGYEDPRGFGVRGRFTGFSQDRDTLIGDLTLNLGTFQLDYYKRLFFDDDIELALGFGPAGGGLEFELEDGTRAEFEGGGVTMFAETFWPGVRFERADLGIVGRARYNLLFGDWNSNEPILIPETDGDSMSVVELAWGFEFRRRFGRHNDHHWYVGLLLEYQRWQSDWMSNTAGTSVGLSGLNVNTGLVW